MTPVIVEPKIDYNQKFTELVEGIQRENPEMPAVQVRIEASNILSMWASHRPATSF